MRNLPLCTLAALSLGFTSVASAQIQLGDLSITALTIPNATIIGGSTVSISVTTTNVSRASRVRASQTGIFVSNDTALTTSDELIALYRTPALAAQQSSTRSARYVFPRSYRGALVYIGAWADAERSIPEFSERNNTSLSAGLRVVPYRGSVRYLEWRGEIVARAAPRDTVNAEFSLRAGRRFATLRVVAPSDIGNYYLLVWSGQPHATFAIDALTDLSIGLANSAILSNSLGKIGSNGTATATVSLPNLAGISNLYVYTHSAWFDSTLSTFRGLGGNSVFAAISS